MKQKTNVWMGAPLLTAAALLACMMATGCGMTGAPQPPSLNLPIPVDDLAATRAGTLVTLSWTMPQKNTDKLLLKGDVNVQVWVKREGGKSQPLSPDASIPVGDEFKVAPGADGRFTMPLVDDWAAGAPRPLRYFVEVRNGNGRSAGMSNEATVVAGAAPAQVTGLVAEWHKQGVILRWTPVAEDGPEMAVRLRRKLLTPPATKPKENLLGPAPEPLERNLLVERGAGESGGALDRALDMEIRLGQSYEYRAQRVARVVVDGKMLELAGELSAPARIAAADVFPPEAPAGLVAVVIVGEGGAEVAIDLNWQPVSDARLVGYIVYRAEGEGSWQRISPAQPLLPPAFHDAQVQAGHTYRYAVSSADQSGQESARSAPTQETVPGP